MCKMSLFYVVGSWLSLLGSHFLALPLGELSPQVTERALSVLAALGHLSQRERQGILTLKGALLLTTSPKGRGKFFSQNLHIFITLNPQSLDMMVSLSSACIGGFK